MEPRISLMTLGVADLDRSRAFYEPLGWSGRSPDDQICLFQLNGMVMGLFDRAHDTPLVSAQDAANW